MAIDAKKRRGIGYFVDVPLFQKKFSAAAS